MGISGPEFQSWNSAVTGALISGQCSTGAGFWGFLPEPVCFVGADMTRKSTQPIVLQVKLTQYGWRFTEGDTSHGLFVSKDKAMSRLKERQKALKADGRASDVVVTRQEDPPRGAKLRMRSTA